MRVMHPPDLPRRFPHHHLEAWTDEQWRSIPIAEVPILDLIPSQEAISLEALARLLNGGQREGGDVAGRAVRWRGKTYLYDGHTRWVIALLTGQPRFPVRIVDVNPTADRALAH